MHHLEPQPDVTRRIRGRAIGVTIGLFVAVAFFTAMTIGPRYFIGLLIDSPALRPRDPSSPLRVWGVFYFIATASLVMTALRMWRMHAGYRRDGAARCPHCVRSLAAADEDGARWSCTRCEQVFRREDLEHFWSGFAERGARELPPGRPRGWTLFVFRMFRRLERGFRPCLVAGMLTMGLVILFPKFADGSITWIEALASVPFTLLMGIGCSLMFYGFMRRRGDGYRCLSCGYEKHPDTPQSRCTECSTWWAEDELLPRGERTRSLPAVALGLVMVFGGIPFLVGLEGSIVRTTLTTQPTSGVISQIEHGSSRYARDAWEILYGRDLSGELDDDDVTALAEVLIERRAEVSFPIEAHEWLRDRMLSTPRPAPFSAWLESLIVIEEPGVLPGPAVVGQPAQLEATVHALSDYLSSHDIGLVVEEILIDGKPVESTMTSRDQMVYVSKLPRALGFFRFSWPIEQVTFADAGTVEVSVRFRQILIDRPFGAATSAPVERTHSGVIADYFFWGSAEQTITFEVQVLPES